MNLLLLDVDLPSWSKCYGSSYGLLPSFPIINVFHNSQLLNGRGREFTRIATIHTTIFETCGWVFNDAKNIAQYDFDCIKLIYHTRESTIMIIRDKSDQHERFSPDHYVFCPIILCYICLIFDICIIIIIDPA